MAEISKGAVGAALGTGIAGLSLGVLNGGLGNLLGALGVNQKPDTSGVDTALTAALMMAATAGAQPRTVPCGGCGCSEDHTINRYEAGQAAKIAQLETEVKLRDANFFTQGQMNDMRNYVDGQFREIRDMLGAQAVHNQKTEDSFILARQDIAAVKAELEGKIEMERKERCCADNSIVNYVNATFYPKMVADVTTGTETTAQVLYNPIPKCSPCGCGG